MCVYLGPSSLTLREDESSPSKILPPINQMFRSLAGFGQLPGRSAQRKAPPKTRWQVTSLRTRDSVPEGGPIRLAVVWRSASTG